MKKNLKRNIDKKLTGDVDGLRGNVDGLTGNVSGLTGDASGLIGDASGLLGNIDDCEITKEERENGINIIDLIG